jgi:hypothetical protein
MKSPEDFIKTVFERSTVTGLLKWNYLKNSNSDLIFNLEFTKGFLKTLINYTNNIRYDEIFNFNSIQKSLSDLLDQLEQSKKRFLFIFHIKFYLKVLN